MKIELIRLVLAGAAVATVSVAFADTRLEDLTVMALGPLDGRAVVKTADGKMQVLKIGDTVPGTKAVVTQVLTDKLIVEDSIEAKGQPAKKQTVWITKPTRAGEKSTVQRLDREGPPPAVTVKPSGMAVRQQ
jgi:hypothetical protein